MRAPAELSTVAATVAHELVAPLSVIASATHLLRRREGAEVDPEEIDRIVAAIERNVAVAQIVVDALRTLDVDGNDLRIAPRPVDLGRVVETVVGDLAPTTLRDHPTQVSLPSAPVAASADPPRVRQVLFNLLSNATKYSPAGSTVHVDVRVVDERIEVVVRDGGGGVAPEDAERIFGKWERATDDVPGLGLGLHLSRAIARAHGGELHLEPSPDGSGAIFVLELPTTAEPLGVDDGHRG